MPGGTTSPPPNSAPLPAEGAPWLSTVLLEQHQLPKLTPKGTRSPARSLAQPQGVTSLSPVVAVPGSGQAPGPVRGAAAARAERPKLPAEPQCRDIKAAKKYYRSCFPSCPGQELTPRDAQRWGGRHHRPLGPPAMGLTASPAPPLCSSSPNSPTALGGYQGAEMGQSRHKGG